MPKSVRRSGGENSHAPRHILVSGSPASLVKVLASFRGGIGVIAAIMAMPSTPESIFIIGIPQLSGHFFAPPHV